MKIRGAEAKARDFDNPLAGLLPRLRDKLNGSNLRASPGKRSDEERMWASRLDVQETRTDASTIAGGVRLASHLTSIPPHLCLMVLGENQGKSVKRIKGLVASWQNAEPSVCYRKKLNVLGE